MPLPTPTRTTDRLTVIDWRDAAIDVVACPDALLEYVRADVPDASTLTLHAGAEPVRYTLRPLNQRELALSREGATTREPDPETPDRLVPRVNPAQWGYELVRFGLVSVEGLDGWTPARERFFGGNPLTLAAVEDLGPDTINFLGSCVLRWSQVSAKKKRASGSSPTPPNGTGPTIAASAPSTAPGAVTTPASASS